MNWPAATRRPALMTNNVVVAASMASATIKPIITNSAGLSKKPASSRREICFAAMAIPDD
jgi:hypothetical protein